MKQNPRVERLAKKIGDYFAAHPLAQDSLEGICRWWLGQGGVKTIDPEAVQNALNRLVTAGRVRKTILADGTVTYSSARNR